MKSVTADTKSIAATMKSITATMKRVAADMKSVRRVTFVVASSLQCVTTVEHRRTTVSKRLDACLQ